MAQVIVLQNALHRRVKLESHPPRVMVPQADATALPPAREFQPGKEDVDRAILLLDIAARQARLLVMEINDPSCREDFEAQIATIEQLLQLARGMALQL
jgi:hypothetical protein